MNLKSLMRRLYSTCLLSMMCLLAFAQGKQIQGVVKDATGEPMIGVNVLVKGTTNGSITDFDGKFVLTGVTNSDVLSVTYIGNVAQDIPVGNQSNFNIVLKEDTETLDEVVVIGYGVMKKRDLTGAVASVKQADIQKVAASNAMQAMQAKIPGLDIQQSDGQAGSGLSMLLRGNRSLTASNSPLILVDGVEYGSTLDINPSDIESMEVLKDASSTAIYGTKGANGVIIITTKRGKKGKTQVGFNAYLSFNSATDAPTSMYGYKEVQRLIDAQNYANDYASGNWGSSNVTAADVLGNNALADGTLLTDIVKDGSYTDWAEELLQNSLTQNYEVSVSGGSDNTNFNISLGTMQDEGLMENDKMKRYNGKINLDHVINKYFKVGTSLLYTYKNEDKRNGGVFNQAMKMTTLTHVYLNDGTVNKTPNPFYAAHCNPLLDEDGAWQKNIETSRFFGNAYLQVTPIESVILKTLFNVDRTDRRTGQYQDMESQGRFQSPTTSALSNERYTSTHITWQNTANWMETFGKHDVSMLLGHELSQTVRETLSVSGDMGQEHYYQSAFYDVSKIGAVTPSSSYVKQSILSFFGRVNYKFANRYLLTASLRADGSSVLAEGNKWGYFPSVAAGWTIKEENWLRDVEWLDNLKLRASWGVSGNAAIDPYQTLGALGQAWPSSGFLIPTSLANKNLTWETTKAWNFGVDFGFLNNRITGSIDYYISKTDDLLYMVSQPSSSVYASLIDNVGSTEGNGIEIALNTMILKNKDFSWDVNWSYSHSKDKVTKLSDGVDRNINGNSGFIVGEPLSIFYDYEADGTWNIGEFEKYVEGFKSRHGGKEPEFISHYGDPGTIKLIDRNDDGVLDMEDRKVIQRSPKHILGMSNTFTYKDFSLSVQLFARLGGYISYNPNGPVVYDGANWGDLDYWTPENPGAKFPSPGLNGDQKGTYSNYSSALMYEKADYLKIKDITLTYNLPQNLLGKWGIGSARVYGSLKNFFTFSDIDNYDPERGGAYTFPLRKQVVVGLSVQF